MRRHLFRTNVLTLAMSAHALIAQAGSQDRRLPAGWHRADDMTMKPGPSIGSLSRAKIPNEYLEVTVARGTVHVEGGASEQIEWTVAANRDSLAGMSYVGTTTWNDRFTLDVEVASARQSAAAPADVQLRVPRDLKLLHISLHGAGNVVVDDYAGELTVTADSGDIAGTNLSGPMILEARDGGVELDLAENPFQHGPISLLSHNGSITVFLPAAPSVVLELNANCGNINSDIGLANAKPLPGSMGNPGTSANQDLDCASRPKALPPLPGVIYLHNRVSAQLGSGAVTLRAMALQGDINLKLARPLKWKWGHTPE